MALGNDFYSEIFVNEQKWIELINAKLLNSIYCNLTLKPFYIEKKKELEEEYSLTNNRIIGQIISIIDNILNQIEVFNEQYKSFQNADINLLLPLFLTTQMNNTSQKGNNNLDIRSNEISNLQINKQVLENQTKNYGETLNDQNDYVYDDFPEQSKIK